jgi:starvation-inducible DNA-binding protein
MITELRDDNQRMVDRLKAMKDTADAAGDNATDGMIDDWTDAAEERVWFLNSLLG